MSHKTGTTEFKPSAFAPLRHAKAGHTLEKITREILTEIYGRADKKNEGSVRPDYVLEEGKWADSKLSDKWSTIKGSIRKYENHCDSLLIVYLLGDDDKEINITEKTKLISVYKLLKKLPPTTRNYYFDRLREIETQFKSREIGSRLINNDYEIEAV